MLQDWEFHLSSLTSVSLSSVSTFCTSASKRFKNFHHGDRFSSVNYGKRLSRDDSILRVQGCLCVASPGLSIRSHASLHVHACMCVCWYVHGFNGFVYVCLWTEWGFFPLPWTVGSSKVENLHKGRLHTAKPLIYSGHPRPVIIIAERKTEEDMPEYGVSSEKWVHTGVSLLLCVM